MFCFITSNSQQLVLPGDHPDPSATKIGDYYYASATTSNWAPAFPIMKSKDLLSWKTIGYVFDTLPSWADYYFWAPEISSENGKVYVYYAAHKKNGNLCLGIATADKPEGPYHDSGPLMCQPDGSIDAFPMRDENGKLYLIWKEDANSIGKPTPIWAMEMSEDRKSLKGEMKELFRNTEKWEGNLVEGVSMIKHGGYFYAFYAASGCCGAACTYDVGVARAKSLLGPWEKYSRNPLMSNSDKWICPGHGTPIEKDGKYYFLYHSYSKKTSTYTGRQGLLMQFEFTPDDWVKFLKQPLTADTNSTATIKVIDNFSSKRLDYEWQWSVFQYPKYSLTGNGLQLSGLPTIPGAYIGQKTVSGDYKATVKISPKGTSATAGIGAVGDDKNFVCIFCRGNKLFVSVVKDGKESIIAATAIHMGNNLFLRMQVSNTTRINFCYSLDGNIYLPINKTPLNGSFLPPWDRAIRVGIFAKGQPSEKVIYKGFELDSH